MQPKVALVLGGGGSRGLAHIGVLKVLEREAIPIDFLVATSMGGVVAVLHALGVSADEIADGMQRSAINYSQNGALQNVRLISARFRQQLVEQALSPVLAGKTFADLQKPVTLMAVDMIHGQEIALTEGELIPALLATSAVPGVFPPVRINDMQLADGGVIDSLATHIAAKQGADKIIAVDVYPKLEKENPWNDPISAIMGFQLPVGWLNGTGSDNKIKHPNMFASMWRSVRVMTWHLHQERLAAHPPEVLLRPDVHDYGSLDFKDMTGPIEAGVAEAENHLPALRMLKQACLQVDGR
jgi:NTE family protein